jgi:hypothetical protein
MHGESMSENGRYAGLDFDYDRKMLVGAESLVRHPVLIFG